MDGRGRVYDNIFIERLWRSLKQEEVYAHQYESVPTAIHRIGEYFTLYNERRVPQSLSYATPAEIYQGAIDGDERRARGLFSHPPGSFRAPWPPSYEGGEDGTLKMALFCLDKSDHFTAGMIYEICMDDFSIFNDPAMASIKV